MKTLYSCGCSFMAIDTKQTGITSFLDLYCKEKNFKHVGLARSGATNFLIRLQIEEAIKQNADYIVIGTTTSDRIDIPIQAKEKDIQMPVELKDIDYQGYRSQSVNYVDTSNPKIISDSINNWTTSNYQTVFHKNHTRTEISQAQIDAMKHYVAMLHNFSLEQTKDYYIISEGLRKLISLGKEFIFMRGPMHCDWAFVGSRLWHGTQPWDLPYGVDPAPVNHSSQRAHNDFTQELLQLTTAWINEK